MSDERQQLLAPFRYNHDHQEPSSSESTVEVTRRQTRRVLSSKIGHYFVLLLVSVDVACIFADFVIQLLSCEGKVPKSDGETALEALSIVSLVFTCLFMAELVASIWAFGFQYFRSKFHCFDAFVILAGFVIDVLLRGVLEEVASLVVILRLWRVFKIIEELSVGAEEQMEGLQERLETLETEKSQIEVELNQLKARVQDSQV